MLDWLFGGAKRRRRREEAQKFLEIFLNDVRPLNFRLSSGGGKATIVKVDQEGEKLHLILQRKLDPNDLKDGKLVPAAVSEVHQRGGKRITHLGLSYRTAEELYKVLGEALQDARRKQCATRFRKEAIDIVFSSFATREKASA